MLSFSSAYEERFPATSLITGVARKGLFVQARPIPRYLRTPREAQLDETRKGLVQKEVCEMLSLGVIEKVPGGGPSHPFTAYSRMIVVPKPHSDKLRPCLDLSEVNKFIPNEGFKMEGIKTAKELLRPGDFLCKVDIKSAYWQVPIARECRDLFRFVHQGTHYRHVGMPMGLNSAPRLFTRIVKAILAPLRLQGIRIVIYLDDILVIGESQREATENVQALVTQLLRLGWLINWEKSVLIPTQRLEFLGLILDTKEMVISLPPHRLQRIKRSLSLALAKGCLSKRQLSSLLGSIGSASEALAHQRLHTQGLLREVRRSRGWDCLIQLGKEAMAECAQWKDLLEHWNGRSMVKNNPDTSVTTDASPFAWGAWLRKAIGQEEWSAKGWFTTEESKNHINWKELLTVLFAVRAAGRRLHNCNIRLETDNMVCMAYVNGQGGRKPGLSRLAETLWKTLLDMGSTMSAVHLAGTKNERADALSREKSDRYDWTLSSEFFQSHLAPRWNFTVDAFASRLSKKMERFWSFKADPDASAIDAMEQCWSGEMLFLNPPERMVGAVLAKLEKEEARGVLVCPCFSAAWTPLLLRCHQNSGEEAVPIPAQEFQPAMGNTHNPYGEKKWVIHAYPVSGKPRNT
tara:strand:- start:1274 stop:3166 length:1893 start_codon:yes stop_codon:yes gene_type:complete